MTFQFFFFCGGGGKVVRTKKTTKIELILQDGALKWKINGLNIFVIFHEFY